MGDARAHWCVDGNDPQEEGNVVIQQRNGPVARAMPTNCSPVGSWDLGWSIEGPSAVMGWEAQFMEQTKKE